MNTIRSQHSILAVAIALVVVAHAAQAAIIDITSSVINPGFEVAGGPDLATQPLGWHSSAGNGFYAPGNPTGISPTQGSKVAVFNRTGLFGGAPTYQGTGVVLVTGTTYTLKIDVSSTAYQRLPHSALWLRRGYRHRFGPSDHDDRDFTRMVARSDREFHRLGWSSHGSNAGHLSGSYRWRPSVDG